MKKPLRVAINGYGRIGRCFLRAVFEANQENAINIVAINELGDNTTIVHLTKYDSTHGRFPGIVDSGNETLSVNGHQVAVFHEDNISKLPWQSLQIDLVIECSGSFSDRKTAEQHVKAGAKKVLFSQPAQSDVDITLVMGVNDDALQPSHQIISNSSCTTNAIVPIIHCLHQQFGVESGVITTIHSVMNDQPMIDAYHHTDLRKTRSAVQSIIPVETGLAKGIERLLPELSGCFQAQAMRVPTVNVSAIDLSVVLKKNVNTSQINFALKNSAAIMPNILGYTEEPLASCDFNHDPRSSIIDASQTRVAGQRLAKILTWFDNEWGYANRMLDVTLKLAAMQ